MGTSSREFFGKVRGAGLVTPRKARLMFTHMWEKYAKSVKGYKTCLRLTDEGKGQPPPDCSDCIKEEWEKEPEVLLNIAVNVWSSSGKEKDKDFIVELLKELFPPPALVLPNYFSRDIVGMARGVFQKTETFGPLSDALEEMDAPAEMYEHCRQGRHRRGCWVIDAILGRK